MKMLAFLLLFPVLAFAEGQTVGPNCSFAWDAGTGYSEGYNVYLGSTPESASLGASVSSTSISCSQLPIAPGQNYIYVRAFNSVGLSEPTGVLPFFVVTDVPGAPINLRII